MNIDELAEHLQVSRRTVYNYREQVDKLIARSSFERVRGVQVLCSKYLPLYETCARGEALPVQWIESERAISPQEYAIPVQQSSNSDLEALTTPVEVQTGLAVYEVRAEVLAVPELPSMPPIVHLHTDLSRVEAYCSGLSTQNHELTRAVLGQARNSANSLKGQVKAIYKTAIVEAQNEALRDSLQPQSQGE